MATSNPGKRNTFVKKANRVNANLKAMEAISATTRRLLTQVAGIALIIATVIGLFVPDLLPTVARLVALLEHLAG